MPVKLVITVKDDDSTYKKEFFEYGEIIMSPDSPVIVDFVATVIKEFGRAPSDIIVKSTMTIPCGMVETPEVV